MKKNDVFTFTASNGVECDMEHSREAIRTFIAYGFSEEEAINILDGKNPDGTEFIELPF